MEPIQHPDFEFVTLSGGVEEYRMRSNGLQVLLLEEKSAPVATFMVTYRVGSRNESNGLTGATHFLEHLMFKGSKNFNRGNKRTVFNVLQRLGAQVNATTWFDRTNYYESLPREHLSLAIEIEADRMRSALLDEQDVASEKTVILNELDRGESEPLRKLYHAVWGAAFVAHPYHHPTIGWRSDVENTTAEALRGFYDTYYWPNNATASIIGDVDRGTALELLARQFGSIGTSPTPIPEIHTTEPEQSGERRVTVRQVGQLGAVMIAFKQPGAGHPDTDALDVLSVILAGGKSSRLYRRLVDNGLATSIFSSASSLRDPGLFTVFATLTPESGHAEVERAVLDEIDNVIQSGVDQKEMQRAQNQIRAQEAYGRDGSFAIAAQLNEAIAAGDWTLYTTAVERYHRVSASDVQRVSGKYCVLDKVTVGNYVPVIKDVSGNGSITGELA